MSNFENKSWWDNNPMTYKDWELPLEERVLNNIDEFRKLNEIYLQANPYLKKFFTDLSSNNYLENKTVLEIGCGWGGFSEYIAKSTGAKIDGLTLSKEQLEFANTRYQTAGLEKHATASYTDYRDSTGQYDKIVSIEMFEAVGEENWDTYFQTIHDRLAPGGSAVLQIITIDNQRFHSYRKHTDFIQRYIFPGGFLPSPEAFQAAVDRSEFTLQETHFFGASYARTCALWNKQFQHAWPELVALGYSKNFKRMWEFYLLSSQYSFRNMGNVVFQIQISKNMNSLPLTRNYIYN